MNQIQIYFLLNWIENKLDRSQLITYSETMTNLNAARDVVKQAQSVVEAVEDYVVSGGALSDAESVRLNELSTKCQKMSGTLYDRIQILKAEKLKE